MLAVKGKAHTKVSQTEKYLLAAGFPQKDPRGFQARLWLGCSLFPLREKLQFSYQSGIKLFSLRYRSFTGMDPTSHLFGGLVLDSVFWAIFSRSKTPPPVISTEFSHKGAGQVVSFTFLILKPQSSHYFIPFVLGWIVACSFLISRERVSGKAALCHLQV